ncbi:TraB/GumN family protein [Aureimonas sp. ME7]|uniref:TraB/GumN family protein n=1 Tax=Aureimonas sp. ME7 TaxID=2744252 RepID=UPI001FCECE30|nr:TraB/GumN family protein [Aureimonas sp. ME7]
MPIPGRGVPVPVEGELFSFSSDFADSGGIPSLGGPGSLARAFETMDPTMKRAWRQTLPLLLTALPHLFPLLLCAALLLAATVSRADAQTPGEAALQCRTSRSLLPDLRQSAGWDASQAKADATPHGRGRFFRVERDGVKPSWLFGTMHLSDPRVLDLPPAVDAALGQADGVVIETTDILDPTKMAGTLLARADLTTLPPGPSLPELLGEANMAKVAPALEARGMPPATVSRLQPWFVAAGLLLPDCEVARGKTGAKVLDVTIAERAKTTGKSLEGLETAAEQLEALASMPLPLQADNLVASVDLTDRLPDLFETMIDLYLRGEIALIGPATESAVPAGTTDANSVAITQEFEDRVVHRRNALMAERLQPILDQGGRFVAVGALHLPGETGLVERLEKAGWRVTPVE